VLKGVKKKRKIIFISAILMALSIATISWAVSNFAFLNIDVTDHPDFAPKLVNNITKMNGNFTVEQGKAQVISGVELFKIDLGAPRFSNQLRINVLLTNPDEMSAVLTNPNSFIEVAVWYEDPAGEHTLNDKVTKVKKDVNASANINRMNGDVLLRPSVVNKGTLYILANITVPGGAPPGQQPPPGSELKFHIDVRM
jgi:hypothetical protein